MIVRELEEEVDALVAGQLHRNKLKVHCHMTITTVITLQNAIVFKMWCCMSQTP